MNHLIEIHGAVKISIQRRQGGSSKWTTFVVLGEDGQDSEITAFRIYGKNEWPKIETLPDRVPADKE